MYNHWGLPARLTELGGRAVAAISLYTVSPREMSRRQSSSGTAVTSAVSLSTFCFKELEKVCAVTPLCTGRFSSEVLFALSFVPYFLPQDVQPRWYHDGLVHGYGRCFWAEF